MKIAILTLVVGDDYIKRMHYSNLSKKEYCKKHSYTFIDDTSIIDKSRPIAWSKILLIKKYLHLFDYVVWIDADAMILNMEHKIEDKIHFTEKKDICVTTVSGMINTGVMIIKNSLNSLKILENVYSREEFIHDGNWEQSSFIYIYENNMENCRKHIKVCEEETFFLQCYLLDLKCGAFIIHMAGFRPEHYDWLLKKIFERLYPLIRNEETEEHYRARMEWYNTQLENSIKLFYEKSPYELIEI